MGEGAPVAAGRGRAGRAPKSGRAGRSHGRVRALAPAIAVTLGLFAVLFAPELAKGRIFAYRDVVHHHLPMARVISGELRAGRFPHWNPYFACGLPLAANPNHYVWYPTRLLDLAFSPETAIQIHLLGHWAAGGIAMAGLALLLGAGAAKAAIAAMAYLLTGPILSLMNFANLVPVLLWIPATAAAAVTLARRPGPRRAAVLAVCLAVQASFAEPGLALAEAMAVIAVLAFDGKREPGRLVRAFPWAAAAIALALILAAPVLGPALRLVAESDRGGRARADLGYSVRPEELLQIAIPQLFGDYHTFEKKTFWQEVLHGGRGPFFLSLSLGCAALALGFAGVVARGRRGALLLAAGGLGVLLAMGPQVGWMRGVMFSDVGRWLRWPVKVMVMPAVLLPLAVAAGIDAVVRRARGGAGGEGVDPGGTAVASRRAAWSGAGAALALAIGAFVLATSFRSPPAAWVQNVLGPVAGAKDVSAILTNGTGACLRSGAAALALALVAAAIAAGWTRAGAARAFALFLPALIAIEMAMPQRRVNNSMPRNVPGVSTPLLRDAKRVAGDSFRIHFPVSHWQAKLERRPGMPDEWWPRILFDRELGLFYHPAGERIPMVLVNPDALVSRGAGERERIVPRLAKDDRAGLLRLIGVAGEVVVGYGATQTGRDAYPTQAGWPVSIAVDSLAVPIVHRAPEDPDLEAGAMPWGREFVRAWEEAIDDARGEGAVRVLERDPGRWVVETEGPAAGRVGLTESRDPGWKALVDGEPAEVEPYLADFMAVKIPAGAHRVEWRYSPPGLAGLLALSAVGWLVAAAGWWSGRRRDPKA